MVDLWYPKGVTTPEQRLRYYASRFSTVEVDSPYYAIPRPESAQAWAERTPPGFIFHVKAYGLMTAHEVDERSLPPELHGYSYTSERGRVRHADPDMVDAAFDLFLDAIDPLSAAGKLGGLLMQFPPYFTATTGANEQKSLDYLDYVAGKLRGHQVLVEFRHPSWVEGAVLQRMLDFLQDRHMSYVSVDGPQFANRGTMPPLALVTGDRGYLRLHGRNADTWFARTATAADRFDYLYTTKELEELVPRVKRLATESSETFVMFNNNKYDYAQRNAAEISTMLGDLVVPPPAEDAPAVPTLF
jgi:uncharacterized protein YecE (DUF72 family)